MLNNVAIGAAYARHSYNNVRSHVLTSCFLQSACMTGVSVLCSQSVGRVVIFDFDVHHGNGTEAIVRSVAPSLETMSIPFSGGKLTIDLPSYQPWLNKHVRAPVSLEGLRVGPPQL